MRAEADSEESAFLFFKHSVIRFTSEGTEQIYPYGFSKEETDEIITNFQTDRPAMLAEFGEMFFKSELSEEFKEWFHGLDIPCPLFSKEITDE